MNILIIEDQKDVAFVEKEVLRRLIPNCNVSVKYYITDEMLTKEFWETKDYDVVLLDLMMPGRSGQDLLEALPRSRGKMKIIILSAALDMYPEAAHMADDVLKKPASAEAIYEAVMKSLP